MSWKTCGTAESHHPSRFLQTIISIFPNKLSNQPHHHHHLLVVYNNRTPGISKKSHRHSPAFFRHGIFCGHIWLKPWGLLLSKKNKAHMGIPKQQLLILLFLITLVSSYQKPRVAEARGLSLMPQQGKNYHKTTSVSLNFLLIWMKAYYVSM